MRLGPTHRLGPRMATVIPSVEASSDVGSDVGEAVALAEVLAVDAGGLPMAGNGQH